MNQPCSLTQSREESEDLLKYVIPAIVGITIGGAGAIVIKDLNADIPDKRLIREKYSEGFSKGIKSKSLEISDLRKKLDVALSDKNDPKIIKNYQEQINQLRTEKLQLEDLHFQRGVESTELKIKAVQKKLDDAKHGNKNKKEIKSLQNELTALREQALRDQKKYIKQGVESRDEEIRLLKKSLEETLETNRSDIQKINDLKDRITVLTTERDNFWKTQFEKGARSRNKEIRDLQHKIDLAEKSKVSDIELIQLRQEIEIQKKTNAETGEYFRKIGRGDLDIEFRNVQKQLDEAKTAHSVNAKIYKDELERLKIRRENIEQYTSDSTFVGIYSLNSRISALHYQGLKDNPELVSKALGKEQDAFIVYHRDRNDVPSFLENEFEIVKNPPDAPTSIRENGVEIIKIKRKQQTPKQVEQLVESNQEVSPITAMVAGERVEEGFKDLIIDRKLLGITSDNDFIQVQHVYKTDHKLDQLDIDDIEVDAKKFIAIDENNTAFKHLAFSDSFVLNGHNYIKKVSQEGFIIFEVKKIVPPKLEKGFNVGKNFANLKENIIKGDFIAPSQKLNQAGLSRLNSTAFQIFVENKLPIRAGGKGSLEIDGLNYTYQIQEAFKGKGSGAKLYKMELYLDGKMQSDFVLKGQERQIFENLFAANQKSWDRAFFKEIEVLDHMSYHPNSLDFHGAIKQGNEYFVAMEKAEGGDILKVMDRVSSPAEKNSLIYSAAEALAALHRSGFNHGDIKPDNFFISKNGHAKISDFGEVGKTSTKNAGKKGDMDRFAVMIYRLKTGKKNVRLDNLQQSINSGQKTAFDELILEVLSNSVRKEYTMDVVVKKLLNVLPAS